MPNRSTKQPLRPDDIAAVWELVPRESWTQAQLELIWDRCIPDEGSPEDLIYFVYNCNTRGLNPLLNECYLQLRWDSERQVNKPTIIVGINGALKRAHASKEFDGIRVEFSESESGTPIFATCKVWRKGCKEPFEATLYYGEYVQLNKDRKPTYVWANKSHVMLSKCSQMAALRMAFADELGGVYIAEEFGTERMPDSDFVVRATSEQTSDVRREEKAADIKPTAEHMEKPTMPNGEQQTLRSRLLADKARVTQDLGIQKTKSKELLSLYFHGFLSIPLNDPLPKQPEHYSSAILMLDMLALVAREDTGVRLLAVPDELGEAARTEFEKWFSTWPEHISTFAFRVAHAFGFEEFHELEEYLQANKINLAQPDDVAAFLRIALLDRELAMEFAKIAEDLGIPPEFLLQQIEQVLDGKIETFPLAKVKGAMASYALAQKV